MKEFFLEKNETAADGPRNGLFFLAAALFISAPVIGVRSSTAVGLSVTAILGISAVLLFWYLLRTEPQTKYFTYFWLSSNGIYFIHGNDAKGYVSFYSWQELTLIEPVLAGEKGEEFSGLRLFTTRHGFRGVPIFLHLQSNKDAIQASSACNDFLIKTT